MTRNQLQYLVITTVMAWTVTLAGATARAQCPLPDGLDAIPGSCCVPSTPTLPTFPAFSHTAMNICWQMCNVDATGSCIADWTAPVPASTASIPPLCTVFVSKLKLQDTAGNLKWKSNMRMWYYTYVGPAAGFVPSTALPIEGGSYIDEVVRHMDLPVPGSAQVCYNEEPVGQGDIIPQVQLCVCGNGPFQYAYAKLRLIGDCGTMVDSIVQFPKGLVSKSIGLWTDPTTYPGRESIRWLFGGYNYDNCVGIGGGDVFYGATSFGGFSPFELSASGPGAPLPSTFIDQGNSLKYPANTPLYNVEFVSDEIMSINLP